MKKKIPVKVIAALAVLILLTVLLMGYISQKSAESARQIVYDAVRRAALTCFATEGVYPPDLAYLRAHYGLSYDEASYTVRYDSWAENQLPDISVEGRR